ncbi:hypothetical protein K7X08_016324 [Anisodus acutangulus]|uniref:Uncharacterized protein n=1 Tax=Anisodus acutangulus TaxID=402998 RepID=A0A9Q1LDY8_9SOLA|nr:hypothetical protein K7X08_016324 [Anisodus acutangulus]
MCLKEGGPRCASVQGKTTCALPPPGPVQGSGFPGSGFSGSRVAGRGLWAVGLLILSFWVRELCQKYSLIPEVFRCTVWSLKFPERQNLDSQSRNAKHSIQPFILAELLLL